MVAAVLGARPILTQEAREKGQQWPLLPFIRKRASPEAHLADFPYDPVVQTESPSPLQLQGRLSGPGLGWTPEGNPEVVGSLLLTQDSPLRGGCKS